uniref:Uncharacterized protein n=1 Tax=Arundo donax TaxID=35708 RepID=A0A0A9EZA4_ARUDO
MTVPMPTPAARPSLTPELYALFSDLLYFSTACFSPVNDATVRMEPMVCSTTTAASAYAAWPREAILATTVDMTAPARTSGGMVASMTRVSSQPCANATVKPPAKVTSSWMNLPTFSPMASWMSTVSPDIRPTTSPVLVCWSKKATSCRRMVLRYRFRIRAACRSPVIIQHATWTNDATAEATAR